MKMKKFKLIVLSSLVLSSLAQPVGVLATEVNNSGIQSKSVSSRAISNPNLMNISSKYKVSGYTAIWGIANRWQTTEWDQGSSPSKIKGNKVGFTSVSNVNGGKEFKLSDYQFTVYDNKKINLRYKGSLIRDASFGVGQNFKTEIGKEYTFSTDFVFDTKASTLTINIGNQRMQIENAGTSGHKEVTFVATEATSYFQVYYYNGTTLNMAATLDNIKIVKSDSQVAIEELKQLLPTFFDKDGNLASNVTAKDLAKAQAFLNKVSAGTEKNKLQATYDKASKLLSARDKEQANQKAAETAVNNMFKDANPATEAIIDGLTQETVDKAKALVNQVKDETNKASLLASIEKVQELLSERLAEDAKIASIRKSISDLFQDNNVLGSIRDDLTQEEIDAVVLLTETVKDAGIQSELSGQIATAQAQLHELNADKQNSAEAAVKGLFQKNDPSLGVIIGGLTQEMIDKATALTDQVVDADKKTEYQKNIDLAQSLFNERVAEADRQAKATVAVNNLFVDGNPTSGEIIDGLTQTAIDAAQKLINSVTSLPKKDALQDTLKKAQNLLTGRIQEAERQKKATAAVNNLFVGQDPKSDEINDNVTTEAINAAKQLVNAVIDSTVKENLSKNIERAEELLKEKNNLIADAEKLVNELFANNDPSAGIISEGLTLAQIKSAKEAVALLSDSTKKTELTNSIKSAEKALNDSEEANKDAATNAINNLFEGNSAANDKLKENVDQKAIDSAQDLLDKVKDTTLKAELQKQIDQAQELFNALQKELSKPKLNLVVPFQPTITGTVPVGTDKVRLVVHGKEQSTAIPDDDGNFVLVSRFIDNGESKKASLKAGDQVTVDYGANVKPELARTVTVAKEVVKPTVNPIKAGQDYITGTVPVGTQVVRLIVNGTAQRVANVTDDIYKESIGGIDKKTGEYRIYSRIFKDGLSGNRNLEVGDVVQIDLSNLFLTDTTTTFTVE
ncbi:toxin Cry1Ac domain D-VI-related protein [Carnobacterium maltaromaticum]|uniref:toxin Cry1Ac domain D-VI-related protein n=1 Tax=Carnobacterium maltaromaticum TaxID=2751 RepID=UPI00295E7E79|nr:toxin Cry1Ac domain D-VI-related protein [Carnobacterium maltaromaticum]